MNSIRAAIARRLLSVISGCGGTVATAPSVISAAASRRARAWGSLHDAKRRENCGSRQGLAFRSCRRRQLTVAGRRLIMTQVRGLSVQVHMRDCGKADTNGTEVSPEPNGISGRCRSAGG